MEMQGAEILEVGTWNGREFSEADLDGVVTSFDALSLAGRIPLKFGHDGDDARDGAPALGWVTRVYREGRKLLADFRDIPQKVYDAIKSGSWKFVSVELLRDVQAGTRKIPWVLDAVALLGATPPAVGTLRDLQALTMATRPSLKFAARVTFNRTGDTEAELRQQIANLQRQLVSQQIETDVGSGRVLPRERELFNRRFGEHATLADWREWVRDVPVPDQKRLRPHTFERSRDGLHAGASRPDEELVVATNALIRQMRDEGEQITYENAAKLVLKRDPDLAERYKYMPLEMWGER